MQQTHTFTKREEIANAITHGIGAAFGVAALTLLIVFASMYGTASHVISFTIYGVTLLLMYVCSTLLHSLRQGRAKNVFEILDHSAIYLFIAGTYTPLMVIVVDGATGWILLSVVWAMAAVGIVFKVFFVKRFIFLSTLFYIAMGWMIVFVLKPIATTVEMGGIVLLVTGGVLYTVGTLFYIWRKFQYHHAVWHLFVLAASVTHFLSILLYVTPV
ncbi:MULTISPECIES: PAQR family membrane homeostasis protein TrhA [Alteribacter]|uniref:Hemolysin III family protein n=1 Tax=Alteribacter keqinensis TaxID=2483800 RepID=A0A3M7U0A0_9BACI|nr:MULTISPECIES: hemolysin III family protein [Alteribacter]MBM7097671.1 hemolysin III family protein [Alteribacter salitolerans]RNA70115.1 hemolysin III family protein [Alteribacter keqinensis]